MQMESLRLQGLEAGAEPSMTRFVEQLSAKVGCCTHRKVPCHFLYAVLFMQFHGFLGVVLWDDKIAHLRARAERVLPKCDFLIKVVTNKHFWCKVDGIVTLLLKYHVL